MNQSSNTRASVEKMVCIDNPYLFAPFGDGDESPQLFDGSVVVGQLIVGVFWGHDCCARVVVRYLRCTNSYYYVIFGVLL